MTEGPEFRFLVNLRAETATAEFRDRVRPYGWLLPPAYASAATKTYATAQARRGVPVLADNGLFDDLSRIARDLDSDAAPLRAVLERLREQVGGPPTRSEVPGPLRNAAHGVAALVEDQTAPLRDGSGPRSAHLAALGLTAFVGAEDPSPGVWARLGIGPEGLGLLAHEWRTLGRRIARAAVEDGRATPTGMGYLPVASPLDEASARYLADEFARSGLRDIAIGFGVLMADRRFGSRVVVNNRAVPLPGNLPASYVGGVVVLRAFLDSYRRRAGGPPNRVHLLGLGSPIMIGLASLLCRDVPLATVDATSPIRDASFGTLYSNRPTLMKLNPDRVVAKILHDQRRTGWTCTCGSCRSFHAEYPQDAVAARQEWKRLGSPTDLALHLVEGTVIGDALPLLALSRTGSSRGPAARSTRIGHNHWSLTRLCADLTRHLRNGTLEAHMVEVLKAYTQSASPAYADAVRWAHKHASSH